MKRFIWVDYAKTIGIYLVILGHSYICAPINEIIYTFHMPLFFFLSGYLFSFERYPSFKKFAWKRFKSLLVPYLWINLITYLFWLLIGRNYGHDAHIDVSWYSPLINTLLGNGQQMIHNIPTWFFICLYVVEMLYYMIFKNCRYIYVFILAIIGFLNYTFNPYLLPFSFNTALVGMIFYALGNLSKENNYKFKPKPIFMIISLLIIIAIAHFNGRINMHINYYGNYFLFLIGGLSGIYLTVTLSTWLSRLFKERKGILYLSNNTLIISGFHLFAFTFMKGIMVFIFHIPVESLSEKIIPNILFSLAALFLCVPVAYIINNYLPFIVGKKRSPRKN